MQSLTPVNIAAALQIVASTRVKLTEAHADLTDDLIGVTDGPAAIVSLIEEVDLDLREALDMLGWYDQDNHGTQ